MAHPLCLERPLVCLDLETTGLRLRADRIVELALIALAPDGRRARHAWRVNPGCPIPKAASAIHGIFDADVADAPTFATIAPEVARILVGADWAGYNLERFDLPMLEAEFQRVGVPFPAGPRAVVDACTIFMRKEPRDLGAAVARYCGRRLEGAHAAAVDAEATLDVLVGQVAAYDDIGASPAELDAFCHPDRARHIDQAGKFIWGPEGAAMNFGKHSGRLLAEMANNDAGYLRWIAGGDFPEDTREVARQALTGRLPVPPATTTAARDAQAGEAAAAVMSQPNATESLPTPRQASLWPD